MVYPLVHRIVVREPGTAGDGLEEVLAGLVLPENNIPVEAQIHPGTVYGACFTGKRLHVGRRLDGLGAAAPCYEVAFCFAVPGPRVVYEHAAVLGT